MAIDPAPLPRQPAAPLAGSLGPVPATALAARLWQYQRERFPVLRHGLLIVVFSGAAVLYAARLAGGTVGAETLLAAWLSSFCCFAQMRVADEFKDRLDDRRHRPYLPVPRGLVSLTELAWLAGLAALLQLLLALAWPGALPALLLLWGYLGLMTLEFGCRRWLRAHQLAYVLSHMPIVPLIAFNAMAFAGPMPLRSLSTLLPYLLACFSNGLVLELARKFRWPEGEEPGVETYSRLLGRAGALVLWLLVLLVSASLVLLAAQPIGADGLLLPLLPVLLLLVLALAWPALRPGSGRPPPPVRGGGGPLDRPAAVWILASYLLLGWLPLLQVGR